MPNCNHSCQTLARHQYRRSSGYWVTLYIISYRYRNVISSVGFGQCPIHTIGHLDKIQLDICPNPIGHCPYELLIFILCQQVFYKRNVYLLFHFINKQDLFIWQRFLSRMPILSMSIGWVWLNTIKLKGIKNMIK